MNKRQERALELFLYATFAIALVAGVGNTKSGTNLLATAFVDDLGKGRAMLEFAQASTNLDLEQDPLQSSIDFAVNDDKVSALGRFELQKHAEFLRGNPRLILNIIGHADSRGSEIFHQVLSEKRARRVYELLLSYGAPQEQLIVDAYSDSSPAQDSAAAERNRSVELQYLTITASSGR